MRFIHGILLGVLFTLGFVSHSAFGSTSEAPNKKEKFRDYNVAPTKSDKSDIKYIVTTLARDSLISVGKQRSSLNKAGDRIEHVHPFRFLLVVFEDEEIKAGVHAIRDRGGWIGSGFFDGLTESLKNEHARGNIAPFISHFAAELKIEADLVESHVKKGSWNALIFDLIDKIPRKIDPNRYNI